MLDPETLRLFQARPERLQEGIEAQPLATDIVIDEVQKAIWRFWKICCFRFEFRCLHAEPNATW